MQPPFCSVIFLCSRPPRVSSSPSLLRNLCFLRIKLSFLLHHRPPSLLCLATTISLLFFYSLIAKLHCSLPEASSPCLRHLHSPSSFAISTISLNDHSPPLLLLQGFTIVLLLHIAISVSPPFNSRTKLTSSVCYNLAVPFSPLLQWRRRRISLSLLLIQLSRLLHSPPIPDRVLLCNQSP